VTEGAPVVVVDGDPEFRAQVRRVLTRGGFAVTEATSGHDALALAAERPAAVVTDVELSDVDGFELCRELHDLHGEELPVIIVTATPLTAHDRIAALLIGADDFLQKPVDPDELLARIRRLTRPRSRSNGARAPDDTATLSPRELEVLRLLASGLGSAAIADRLVISPKTVASHVERLMAKLGVHSRAQAVAEAYRRGLVDDFEAHLADMV